MSQRVSVVTTVLDEAESIGILLDSLLAQTRPPDELVVVDGGSTDGTLGTLERFADAAAFSVKVLTRPGCNISQGRNAAIEAASGSIIAVTDAGVRLEVDWLGQLVAPFAGEDPPDVVAGFFVSDPQSTFELALGAVTLPLLEEVDPDAFHPSSRSVAFRRSAWQAVNGYPDWLDYCEDLLFDFALRDAGYAFIFAPSATVKFRPRQALKAFFRQYFHYARGDGKADFWRCRHLVRYATYLAVGPLLFVLSLVHHPAWLLALVVGIGAMMRKAYWRLLPLLSGLPMREKLLALLWVPIIRCAGDLAKMLGYPVGVWWRWHHAPSTPWPKRHW